MTPTLKTNFTSYKPVALISGPFFHHLDHLAPLCHFIDCPLLVDDKSTYLLGKKYYPEVDIRLVSLSLKELSSSYNLIILSTKHAKDELSKIYKSMNINFMRFCFCPHGQSDKGLFDSNALSESGQDLVLFYGERQKNIIEAKENYFIVGNFRLAYYEKFKAFYDKLMDEILSPLPKQNTILYSPTWNDQETATTFFQFWKELIFLLPDNYNLIVKLHPLLEKHHPAHTYEALSYNQTKPNILTIFEMPLIYPLLNRTDIYLGDYSAIGYDFLYFNRPLFFLGEKKVPLYDCGIQISSVPEFYEKIETTQTHLSKKRMDEYAYTFSPFL
jgi:hypothetical protein